MGTKRAVGFGLAILLVGFAAFRSSSVRVVNMGKGNVFPCSRFAPAVRFEKIPGCSATGNVGSHQALFSYNSLGLRDRDYASRPPPETTRILMLDGSILAGAGLAEPLSPVRQLETTLRAAGWKRVEVINGAVEGFSTVENAIVLGKYLNAYHPEVVVLYSITNFKMFNDLVMGEYLEWSPGGAAERLYNPMSLLPASVREGHSRFLLRLMLNAFELFERLKVTVRLLFLSPPRREEEILSVTLDMLKLMRDEATLRGAKFYVLWDGMDSTSDIYLEPVHSEVLFRAFGSFLPKFTVTAARVERALRESGIPLLNAEQEFKSRLLPADYMEEDHHFNERGAAEFAKICAEKLLPLRSTLKRSRTGPGGESHFQ